MSKKILSLLLLVFVIGLFTVSGMADENKFQYIGTDKCKMCHMSKKSGAAYKIWQSSQHSKAYETLANEQSMKIAKEMGIDDPQKSDKCLKCHVTGHGKDPAMFQKSFSKEEGIGCEACHGPGSEYKSMRVMKQLYADEVKDEEYGLVMPTAEDCKTCHNEESPTFKGFNFEEMWSEIAHPVPEK